MSYYPFNHECQWRGPFYIWSSNKVELAPPPDCEPVECCCICGKHMADYYGQKASSHPANGSQA